MFGNRHRGHAQTISRKGKVPWFGAVLVLALLSTFPAQAWKNGEFAFALVGDYNYGPVGSPPWQESKRMIAAVNRSGVRFAVHLGDILVGGAECSDAVIAANRRQFALFQMPLIYLFGDNEWTDCHRYGATHPDSPYADPLERLAHLRHLFYSGTAAQGKRRLVLTRQADLSVKPEYRRFVENVRWESGGVLFVGVNVPGSNNNYSGGPDSPQTIRVSGQDGEWALRNAAVIDWLRGSFRRATAIHARAVVILWHANSDLENRHPYLPMFDSNGFQELNRVLSELAGAFKEPVLLAHGDSHRGFRSDRPLALPNFMRVENYGAPNTHWTKITVLPGRTGAGMFRLQGMRVPGNPYLEMH